MLARGPEVGNDRPGARSVLVVEDEDQLRAVLVRLLGAEGYEVEAYPDATSALARIGDRPGRGFDLLLVDVMMPDLNGIELVERIRELLAAMPPVIYISGAVEPALNDAPGTLGGETILPKPFQPEELFEAIDSVCA